LAEKAHEENKHLQLADRNWNWKSEDFHYSESRATDQPGYVGSYAMDCLSMALHCVWTTETFSEAVLKCANIRGDADTVSAVTGQIAGALYGISQIPTPWLQAVQKWDNDGDISLRAFKLYQNGSKLIAAQKSQGINQSELNDVEINKLKELQNSPQKKTASKAKVEDVDEGSQETETDDPEAGDLESESDVEQPIHNKKSKQ